MGTKRTSRAARLAQAYGGHDEVQPAAPVQAAQQPVKLLLTVDEALPLMGSISLRTFQRETKAGRIYTVHVGRRVLVPYAALVAYVRLLCDEQGVPLDALAMAG